MGEIELLGPEAVRRLAPRADAWAECARRHVGALVEKGTRHFVDNVDVDVGLLGVGEQLLPVVATRREVERDAERPVAAVVSPRAHYADYTREEMGKRRPGIAGGLLDVAFAPLGAVTWLGNMDEVVFVNNWLLTTNPAATYSASELKGVLGCLTESYPSAAIVFRGIIPEFHPEQFELFQNAGMRMIRYRRVWVVEDAARARRESPELRRDLNLSNRLGYEIVDDPRVIDDEAERLAVLYRSLYLSKHSMLNLHFNAEFIRLAQRDGLFTYRAFRRDGAIDAVKAWFVKDGMMTGAFVGYDRSKPKQLGLYRQAMALQSAEAAKRGLPLHLSGGVGGFKALRGASPFQECEAVWDKHLSARRRLPWAVVERAGQLVA